MNENLLSQRQSENAILRRRDLLPIWIKIFIWIFLIYAILLPMTWALGILGIGSNVPMNFDLSTGFNASLYGLATTQPLSLVAISILVLYLFKGIVAFGLWTEKDWAVNFAIVDAITGLLVCGFVMIILPFFSDPISFKVLVFDLILLILYLRQMRMIRREWSERV